MVRVHIGTSIIRKMKNDTKLGSKEKHLLTWYNPSDVCLCCNCTGAYTDSTNFFLSNRIWQLRTVLALLRTGKPIKDYTRLPPRIIANHIYTRSPAKGFRCTWRQLHFLAKVGLPPAIKQTRNIDPNFWKMSRSSERSFWDFRGNQSELEGKFLRSETDN